MLRLITRKENPMIVTAIKLQETTKEAVHDPMVMEMAAHLFHARNVMDDEDFAKALYQYSAMLSALTTTLATTVLLTEEEIDTMASEIKEFEQLGKDITNGND
jgi:hypothetical protein